MSRKIYAKGGKTVHDEGLNARMMVVRREVTGNSSAEWNAKDQRYW
jgi:hypothetical protein